MNVRHILAIGSMFASCAMAQDFVSVTPNATVLKDDGRVRVIDYRAKAGDKLPMHSHPYMVVYLLEGAPPSSPFRMAGPRGDPERPATR